MDKQTQPSARIQIRNLLLVLFSGVGCAVALMLFMLYYYGPSGRYAVKNVLLSPDTIHIISSGGATPKKGVQARLHLDKIELAYWLPEVKGWRRLEIDQEHYMKFYNSIANDNSILEVPEDVVNQFYREHTATLSISVRADSAANSQPSPTIFQQVSLPEHGDYFRIQIRSQNTSGDWAYFRHPHVYQDALKLLLPNTPGE